MGSNFYPSEVNSSICFSKILNKSNDLLESQIYAPEQGINIYNLADSYNIKSYFTPIYTKSSSQTNLIAKQTAFCASQTQTSVNDYINADWWLRTGVSMIVGFLNGIYITNSGGMSRDAVTSLQCLRPAMVLNVA